MNHIKTFVFSSLAMIQGQERLQAENNSTQKSHGEVAAHLLIGHQTPVSGITSKLINKTFWFFYFQHIID